MRKNIKILFLYLIILILFIIDISIKQFFIKNPLFQQDFLFLSFKLTQNEGIAFGISINKIFLFIIIIILISTLFLAFLKVKNNYIKAIIFLLILASFSNFTDRIRFGAVIDYIEIPRLIALNIADIMVTIGGFIISLYYILKKYEFTQ